MEEHKFRHKLYIDRFQLKNDRPSIQTIYPNIEEIRVNLQFTYYGGTLLKQEKTILFAPQDKAFFMIDCINVECVYTDLDLSEEIQGMVSKKETTMAGAKSCKGYQDYRRFLASANKCLTEMEFEIIITYK